MDESNVIAVFEFRSGKRRALRRDDLGLYLEWQEYNGAIIGGTTSPASWARLAVVQWAVEEGRARVIQSPGGQWYVCTCQDCAAVGGRVWDQSQGSFKDHLKSVHPGAIFTFPEAEKNQEF